MTDLAQFVENSADEIESKVLEMEDSFLEDYIMGFVADFDTLDGEISATDANQNRINSTNKLFDDAYDAFILAFLLFLGNKILEGAHKSVAHFHDIGVSAKYSEVDWIENQIGLVEGKVVKGSYLWNLGQQGEIKQRFQSAVMQAVQTGQKTNAFLRNVKPIFKSTETKESWFARYYRKYAYDAVGQSMNTISLYIADKKGLTNFLYSGSLIKDSRLFCKAHAGNTYSRADAKQFDSETWKGKIPDIPFLIQVGGYQCRHTIVWLSNTK
jgi:hypothetical protein